jgi:hypothetical protein
MVEECVVGRETCRRDLPLLRRGYPISVGHACFRVPCDLSLQHALAQNLKPLKIENLTSIFRLLCSLYKACRAIQPMYFRVANNFSNVIFVEVPVSEETSVIHQGLGVPSLPYAHIYHPQAGLCEELKISRKFLSEFANKLQTYVTGSCELKNLETASPYSSCNEEEEEEQ